MPRLLLLFILAYAFPAQAFEEINTSYFGNKALEGYDSTAYFDEGRPEQGQEIHSFTWKGAEWHFATAADRDQFAANPDAYAPQYGGYCSNQMSLGNLSDVDPGVWLIHDGKLYLFGHDVGLHRWQRTGIEARVRDADLNWQNYLKKK